MKTLKFITMILIACTILHCGTSRFRNQLTVAGNASVPKPAKVYGTYKAIAITQDVLDKFDVVVSNPNDTCKRDLNIETSITEFTPDDDVPGIFLNNFLDYAGQFTNLTVPDADAVILRSEVFGQSYTGTDGNTARCEGQLKQFGDYINVILSCRVKVGDQPTEDCSVGMARKVEKDGNGENNSITGIYKSADGNTCYDPESGDTDNLVIEVEHEEIHELNLDDDYAEIVEDFSNNTVTFSFMETSSSPSPVPDDAQCTLDFSGNVASGDCSVGSTHACDLRYEKCSDDIIGTDDCQPD